jgi:magnesium chelatase family protein
MDISTRVDRIDPELLLTDVAEESSKAILCRVMQARAFAAERAERSLRATLQADARVLLEQSARRMHLSGRGITRLLRVARTIADMDSALRVRPDHVSEALVYREWEA